MADPKKLTPVQEENAPFTSQLNIRQQGIRTWTPTTREV